MNFKLYKGDDMEKILKESGFSDIVIEYYKGFWIPIKGYIIPKGMVVKAKKMN